jgi:hypothetical protein
MSVAPQNLVIAALDDLVYAIASTGIKATRDPNEMVPPAAIVTAPSFVGGTLGALVVTVPVYFVATDAGQAGLDQMIELFMLAYPALGTRTATPTLWVSPLNPDGLPAYVVSVTLTIEG